MRGRRVKKLSKLKAESEKMTKRNLIPQDEATLAALARVLAQMIKATKEQGDEGAVFKDQPKD